MSKSPIPRKTELVKPVVLRDPRLTASSQNALNLQRLSQQISSAGRQHHASPSPAGAGAGVKPLQTGGSGALLSTQIPQSKPSTVLAAAAAPIKQEPGKKSESEGSNKREKELAPSLPKRLRLTRKSAGAISEQNQ